MPAKSIMYVVVQLFNHNSLFYLCYQTTTFAEFNGESFKAYRMKILLLEIHEYLTAKVG